MLPAVATAATIKVDVTRFHLLARPAPTVAGASIMVEPAPPPGPDAPAAAPALQFGALAAMAATELGRAGFKPPASGASADYIARIALNGSSEQVTRRSPISIGIGGGRGGWNGGVSGGVAFPLGGGTRTVTTAMMSMQIRRASDNSAVWEGRASATAPTADPYSAAPALLKALLGGFPGPSGQSLTVKVKTTP
jgi:hypothetical protein